MQIGLSPKTEEIITLLFDEEMGDRIKKRFISEKIPAWNDNTPQGLERLRFSIIKLIHQNETNEGLAFELANTDWRDLLMSSEFAYDAEEHLNWYTEITQK